MSVEKVSLTSNNVDFMGNGNVCLNLIGSLDCTWSAPGVCGS